VTTERGEMQAPAARAAADGAEAGRRARIMVVARSGSAADPGELRRLAQEDRAPDPVLAEDWLNATAFTESVWALRGEHLVPESVWSAAVFVVVGVPG